MSGCPDTPLSRTPSVAPELGFNDDEPGTQLYLRHCKAGSISEYSKAPVATNSVRLPINVVLLSFCASIMTISTCRANMRSRGIFAFATPVLQENLLFEGTGIQIQASPSSLERASNRACPEKIIPAWLVVAAPPLAPVALGQGIGKNVLFLRTA